MDKSLYTKTHVATKAADGALGAPAAQVNYGTQFAATSRYSLQVNREFDTLANAQKYAYTHDTAYPGIIITVSDDDTPANNGAYLVINSEPTTTNTNGLELEKLVVGDNIDNIELISDKQIEALFPTEPTE